MRRGSVPCTVPDDSAYAGAKPDYTVGIMVKRALGSVRGGDSVKRTTNKTN
jgi:hypothetical protein